MARGILEGADGAGEELHHTDPLPWIELGIGQGTAFRVERTPHQLHAKKGSVSLREFTDANLDLPHCGERRQLELAHQKLRPCSAETAVEIDIQSSACKHKRWTLIKHSASQTTHEDGVATALPWLAPSDQAVRDQPVHALRETEQSVLSTPLMVSPVQEVVAVPLVGVRHVLENQKSEPVYR